MSVDGMNRPVQCATGGESDIAPALDSMRGIPFYQHLARRNLRQLIAPWLR